MKGKDAMNVIKSSVFYRMCAYVINIHEHSLFYKSRKKDKGHHGYKSKIPTYRQARIYRILCAIGALFGRLFTAIHNGAKSSGIMGAFGSVMDTMKKSKLWAFNQLIVSIIVGYTLGNVVFGTFATYKVKYLVAFIGLMIGMNICVYLLQKYKGSSFIWKLWKSLTQ